MSTQRIPIGVLTRLVDQTRVRPPAVVHRPPAADDDFAEEEAPSVLVAVQLDGSVHVERLPEPTQRSLLSEILAASTRVAFG